MSKAIKAIIEYARKTAARAREESDNINVVIAALVGALFSKVKEDVLDIEAEHIYVDSNPNTMDESVILTIEYDEDGTLVYTDTDNEEGSSINDLPLNTRIELAEKLAELLET
jgi:hypothetical protein